VCVSVCVVLEMSCLMSAMKDSNVHLRDDCAKQLQQRIKLWNAAVKVASALRDVSNNALLIAILAVYISNNISTQDSVNGTVI